MTCTTGSMDLCSPSSGFEQQVQPPAEASHNRLQWRTASTGTYSPSALLYHDCCEGEVLQHLHKRINSLSNIKASHYNLFLTHIWQFYLYLLNIYVLT